LGFCLGTQIIFVHSEEDGGTDCLGLIPRPPGVFGQLT
jgi:imidazoleglycerol phosphate synthase glutamine amidotransferase subunit HisH